MVNIIEKQISGIRQSFHRGNDIGMGVLLTMLMIFEVIFALLLIDVLLTSLPTVLKLVITALVAFLVVRGGGELLADLIRAAILLHIIAGLFFPELPEKLPFVWEVSEGVFQLLEFIMKAGIKGIHTLICTCFQQDLSIVTEFNDELFATIGELFKQFSNWVLTIHY